MEVRSIQTYFLESTMHACLNEHLILSYLYDYHIPAGKDMVLDFLLHCMYIFLALHLSFDQYSFLLVHCHSKILHLNLYMSVIRYQKLAFQYGFQKHLNTYLQQFHHLHRLHSSYVMDDLPWMAMHIHRKQYNDSLL